MKDETIRCKTCRFFDPEKIPAYEGRDEYHGYCVRFPPVINFSDWGNRCWPYVQKDDWCGEYNRHPAGGTIIARGDLTHDEEETDEQFKKRIGEGDGK